MEDSSSTRSTASSPSSSRAWSHTEWKKIVKQHNWGNPINCDIRAISDKRYVPQLMSAPLTSPPEGWVQFGCRQCALPPHQNQAQSAVSRQSRNVHSRTQFETGVRASCSYGPVREVGAESSSNVVLTHLHYTKAALKSIHTCLMSTKKNLFPFLRKKCIKMYDNYMPLVACCLVEPSQEHADADDCTQGSTNPTVHQIPPCQCHAGNRRSGPAQNEQPPPCLYHAVTGSDLDDVLLSESWWCLLSLKAGALDRLRCTHCACGQAAAETPQWASWWWGDMQHQRPICCQLPSQLLVLECSTEHPALGGPSTPTSFDLQHSLAHQPLWGWILLSVHVGCPSSPAASLACINCTKIAWLRSTRNFFRRGCSVFISQPMRSIKCIASCLTEKLDLHKAATLVAVSLEVDWCEVSLPLQHPQSMFNDWGNSTCCLVTFDDFWHGLSRPGECCVRHYIDPTDEAKVPTYGEGLSTMTHRESAWPPCVGGPLRDCGCWGYYAAHAWYAACSPSSPWRTMLWGVVCRERNGLEMAEMRHEEPHSLFQHHA